MFKFKKGKYAKEIDKYEKKMKKCKKFYDNPIKEETYALYENICDFMIPRLRLYKEGGEEVIEFDHVKIDKMILAFEHIRNEPWFDADVERTPYNHSQDWQKEVGRQYVEIYKPQIDEGLKIFAEEFMGLWW